MAELKSVVDILKILEKSNCKECGEPTCMAFAAAIFQGRKQLGDCPRLEKELVEKYGGSVEQKKSVGDDMKEAVAQLKKRASEIDLEASAERLGGKFKHGNLILKIMGKEVQVDKDMNIKATIHMHPMLQAPILSYILECNGVPDSGKWVPMRELNGGKDWYRLFGQRCEKPLKKVADEYTELFEDMIFIFNGENIGGHFESDIAVVLRPLPRFPILICYWKPDDGMESELNVFFDANAEENLRIESIYALASGLVWMFEKIALTHGK